MTEKYFSASFGRFESFFIAYHVELLLLGQQTVVRRILILSFFISLFMSRIKFQPPRFHQHFFFLVILDGPSTVEDTQLACLVDPSHFTL